MDGTSTPGHQLILNLAHKVDLMLGSFPRHVLGNHESDKQHKHMSGLTGQVLQPGWSRVPFSLTKGFHLQPDKATQDRNDYTASSRKAFWDLAVCQWTVGSREPGLCVGLLCIAST